MTGIFSTLTVIDPNWPMCRLCRLWSILIGTGIEFLTVNELEWLKFWFYRMWLTLFGSYVDFVNWIWPCDAHVSTLSKKNWLGHESILLAVIDPNWRMSRIYWLYVNTIGSCCDCFVVDRPWSAHILTLSTKFDNDMLICRLCRMKLTLIC